MSRQGEDPGGFRIEGAKCIKDTGKAILVEFDNGKMWVPQVCVTDDSEVWREGDEGDLVIKESWASTMGLM